MTYIPVGIKAIESCIPRRISVHKKNIGYSIWTWIVTYMIYTSYHLSRKPISVVKNVLDKNCSGLVPPSNTNNSHWCDWKPFDEDDSKALLGTLDSVYLFAYAFAMFFSGYVAERSNLSIFMSFGMILSGMLTALFGLGYTFGIHFFWFYFVVQLVCGVFQSSGWPGVVTAMGNWFGKKKRGFIMGIWNSHTSLGNILGTIIAAAFVKTRWDLSFIIPGLIIGVMGVIVLLFLLPSPTLIGLPDPNQRTLENSDTETTDGRERQRLLENEESSESSDTCEPASTAQEEEPVDFVSALTIPGVAEFSLSLFFSKLVSYTFLYWLPNYIYQNTMYNSQTSALLSTIFDIGGILGAVLAGMATDASGRPATTCAVMLVLAIPMMHVYQMYASFNLAGNIILLTVVGLLVNGPYALITTAVSADLGTSATLRGNAKALSTVTSIIDGTGSIGAAVGPLLAGVLSMHGWIYVFYMLMAADVVSLLLLIRLVVKESKCCLTQTHAQILSSSGQHDAV